MTGLSHIDAKGSARMVDVGDKPVTLRKAVAGGSIGMTARALQAIEKGKIEKGAVLETAPYRWHHGCEADGRAYPAMSCAPAR